MQCSVTSCVVVRKHILQDGHLVVHINEIIDCKFYVIDSLSCDVSASCNAKLAVA